MKIAFIHPDLGIGGAERLVVDAAIGLQLHNHQITIYTSHCDKSHCFEEVKTDLRVIVYGDWLPTTIFGRFHILCSIVRQLYLVCCLVNAGVECDWFIIDQLSFCIPLLQMWFHSKILFYCHFPDQLLATKKSWLRSVYRWPFDLVEEVSTGFSDVIVVNSCFTKNVFHKTFKLNRDPAVIYPCVDTPPTNPHTDALVSNCFPEIEYFISINRYEVKKNIDLAINSFAIYHSSNPSSKLIIAGGYDHRVPENVNYLSHLQSLTTTLNLSHQTSTSLPLQITSDVLFLTSITSTLKDSLIKNASLLLYTPSNEHFGIVPIESMRLGTPVLAVNNGGPCETIVDGETGYLVEANVEKWVDALSKHMQLSKEKKSVISQNGVERVEKLFTREIMTMEFIKNLNCADDKIFTFKKLWVVVIIVLIGIFVKLLH